MPMPSLRAPEYYIYSAAAAPMLPAPRTACYSSVAPLQMPMTFLQDPAHQNSPFAFQKLLQASKIAPRPTGLQLRMLMPRRQAPESRGGCHGALWLRPALRTESHPTGSWLQKPMLCWRRAVS
eukprot:gnl/TRDRNA2_/TRDRNA2_174294_c11_seq1.p1 gnl/TRDRNA2_/TRDRNA2_174294_c11~~gnl/TRDRNA2_/TRDRNA2_174294_c11_seq1.p1  ORF type:complete len:123 (-),score=8.06 gnl/TRDRNA2_/TRDRNA2_174294_c11_seq1:16-384(-)